MQRSQPDLETVNALAEKLCDAIGKSHSDVALCALAGAMAAVLKQVPAIDTDEALEAFATNVRIIMRPDSPVSGRFDPVAP